MDASPPDRSGPALPSSPGEWIHRGVVPGVLLAVGVAFVLTGLGSPVPGVGVTLASSAAEGTFLLLGGFLLVLALHGALEAPSAIGVLLAGVGTFAGVAIGEHRQIMEFEAGRGLLTAVAVGLVLLGPGLLVASKRARDAAPDGESGTPLVSYVMAAVVLAGGVVFTAVALGEDLGVVRLSFGAEWLGGVYLLLGLGALYLGGRATFNLVSREKPTLDEVKRNWRKTRPKGLVLLLSGLVVVATVLLDDRLAAVDVQRGAWFLWLFGPVSLLLSLIILWNPEGTIEKVEKAEARERGELKTDGEVLRGRATIVDFDDTGTTINDNPRVRFRLRMELEGTEPYEIEHVETVPRLSTGRLLKGESLPVLADSEERDEIVILWKEK